MPPRSALLSELYRLTSPPPGDAELLRRWVERRDEDAFTALVSRHGRMVHGVCRRVLGNSHDADDAFQAVFLTLARKADGLRNPEALSGWLHGVAVRLACKARAAALRRRWAGVDASTEPADPHPDPLESLSARELMGLIDREIARLPEKYRLPLLLCDLEERTQEEAARLLGWTLGSFRGRLLRGRERLRARLAQRGMAPAVLAAAFAPSTADAAALTASVSRLAVRFAACPASAGVSPSAAALLREGIGGMMLGKLKFALVVLLAVSTIVSGAGLLIWPTSAPQSVEERSENKPPRAETQVRRDQVGDPLPPEALSRLGTLRLRHGGLIQSLAFAPDGKTLISEGHDGLRIWDTATGKQIRRVGNGSCGGASIDISPDGKLVALLLPDSGGYVGLMEIATGRIVRRFSKLQVEMFCFAPGGKMIATVGFHITAVGNRPQYHSEIDIWDSATGKALGTLKGHEDCVTSITFSADGKTLVSAGDDRTIRFWDVAAGKELRQIVTENGVEKIALSPDGRILASLGHIKDKRQQKFSWWLSEAVIRLWDARTGKELRRLTMPPKEIRPGWNQGFSTLLFTRDGKTLVTGGYDGVVRVWDGATAKELRHFSGFGSGYIVFALHPDDKTLAVVSGGAAIRLIRQDTGATPLAWDGHQVGVGSVFLRPDGRVAVTSTWEGLLRFWDARTGKALAKRSHAMREILPDGRTYLAEGEDKKLRVRDLDTGKEIRVLQGWREDPNEATLSPDGRILAQIDRKYEKMQLINTATGAVLHTLARFNLPFMGASFSPDSSSLFIWSCDKTVTVWDTASGKKRQQFSVPTQPKKRQGPFPSDDSLYSFPAKLSADGKLLAFGLYGILPLVDAASGKEVRRFATAADGVSAVAFSPDGKSLAWGGWREGTVYLGEVATGKERCRFTGHIGRIFSLAFSADGKTLISGSIDTTALVWDLSGELTMGKKIGTPLSAEDLESHWKTLAGEDATAAFRAMQILAADPARAVPYLRKRLHPVAAVEEKRLQQWIADLDSDQFAVREKAASELEKAGAAALPAMQKALADKPSPETRRRLQPLIEKQQREEWSPSAENLRSRRALEVLERAGTAEAKEVLTILANGAPGVRQTLDAKAALERLAQR